MINKTRIELEKNIICNFYNFNKNKKTSKIILACHGFDSSKNSVGIEKIAEACLEENIGVISFDWPGHGENTNKLTLSNCFKTLDKMENYVKEKFKDSDIFLYGSSFGAYMILIQFIYKKHNFINNKYKYIFLKSPAINMKSIFENSLIEEDIENMRKRGYTIKNRNKKMVIPYEFYKELSIYKINEENIKKVNEKILVFHGKKDTIAAIDDTEKIMSNLFEIVKFENANHSFEMNYLENMINIIKSKILQA